MKEGGGRSGEVKVENDGREEYKGERERDRNISRPESPETSQTQGQEAIIFIFTFLVFLAWQSVRSLAMFSSCNLSPFALRDDFVLLTINKTRLCCPIEVRRKGI